MPLGTKDIQLNRFRSYSSIFSTTSFERLLRKDDFSFLLSKIERYDQLKVGYRINTYYDYIRYVYNELQKKYRTEYFYKNAIINELLLKIYGTKDTIMINEFRVGSSIADSVLFNGTSKSFEIKTELDSNARLSGQLADYSKLFQECYVVTHESLCSKYMRENRGIGIIQMELNKNTLKLNELRPPILNTNIDPDILMRSVRTAEYKNIIKSHFGELPEMNSFNMFEICKGLMRKIPSDELHLLFIAELKKRKSNTSHMSKIPKEIRQICLAINASQAECELLESKLKRTIKL
jgi:hypothetical protein